VSNVVDKTEDLPVGGELVTNDTNLWCLCFDCFGSGGLKLNHKKMQVHLWWSRILETSSYTNNRNLDAVKNFITPTNLRQLRQFLELTSHYCRFVLGYAKITHPLYLLTEKGAVFQWTTDWYKDLFKSLWSKLVAAPVLAYPNFKKDFVLETDTSQQDLGAILSQYQDNKKLHPVAYASQSVSTAECNYAITNLETLAVFRAVTHFCMDTRLLSSLIMLLLKLFWVFQI